MAADYEVNNFEEDVIDASRTMPVVVDFWAAWCSPCLMLEPILVQLAEENKGRWKLAKVNTDHNEELANRYNIRGIPAIRIFNHGEIVASFNGLMYKPEFQRWLDENLPDENEMQLTAIKQMIESDRGEDARVALEALTKSSPGLAEARVLLAAYYILDEPAKASAMVSDIAENSPFYPTAEAIHILKELNELYMNQNLLADENGKEEVLQAIAYIQNKELDEALESFLSVLHLNKGYHNNIADRAIVAIFTILGNSHPLTIQYRKRFDVTVS
jgi:putative thioredoxin